MFTQSRRIVAAMLLAGLALSACDVSQQTTQQPTAPQAAQPNVAPTDRGAGQSSSPAAGAQAPTAASSLGLTDQTIGSGGVAQAQTRPTAVTNGDGNLISDYERTVNNVYARNIGALVNLTDGRVTGSGFVVDAQGHIITNNHVASELQEIVITFADRSTAQGRLVGSFELGDIAVVQADRLPDGLQPAELGDSGTLQVGQLTVAMGSPLGLEQTVTAGIISALNRTIEDIERQSTDETKSSSLTGLIQTDASINPGNSGGPLFDSHGRVIGMNTLIATRASSSETAGSIGLGFAVPINRIKRVFRQIVETGQYRRPSMGISGDTIQPQIARALNLPVTSGVMIGSVKGAQAQQAGLRGATKGAQLSNGEQFPVDGDIIVAINNTPIRTLGDLRNVLETQADPGDTITLTILRDGREQNTKLTLQ